MAEIVESCDVEIACMPRVSRRRLGDRMFGLPDTITTACYRVTLVRQPQRQRWQIDCVQPLAEGFEFITVDERLGLRDLVVLALATKYPDRVFSPWPSTLIAVGGDALP